MSRKALGVAGAFLALTVASGCIPKGVKSPSRGSNAILADIAGISAEDRQLKNIVYTLICEQGDTTNKFVASTVGEKEVAFPGDKIKDGDVCAMEITADVPENDGHNYVWYSSPEQPGLFYSSNKDAVKSRGLNLSLYKIYGKEGGDIFLAQVTAALELPTGETLPDDKNMLANIECGANENFPSGAPTPVTSQATQRVFTFRLSAAKMKGVTCSKMVVRKKAATGYENAYEGAITGVTFVDPKVSTTVSFGPFNLKKAKPQDISVQTVGAVECSKFNTTTRQCLQIKLPRAENFWLALVTYKKNDNTTADVLVSGPAGLNLDNTGAEKSLDAIKTASSATSGAGYTFFDPARKAGILAADFNGALFANNSLQSQPASSLGVNGANFIAFKEIYIHGFKEVSDADLNKAAPAAIWFAHVEASKDLNKGTFVITGNNKYFTSSAKTVNGGQAYFSWDDFKKDRDDGTIQNFRSYGIKAGAAAPFNCNIELSYYTNNMSNWNKDFFAPSSQDAKLEACEITSFPKTFDTWTIKSKMYLWAWHSLVL